MPRDEENEAACEAIFLRRSSNLNSIIFQIARDRVGGGDTEVAMPKFTSLKSMSGSDDGLDRTLERQGDQSQLQGQTQQRTNSSVHVCWHRSTTVPVAEYHRSLRNLLSGYLLRKFKSSNGWQKLWVIFTNSCLFFFKTFEDDFPLASLPLLGYSVRQPDASDGIAKDYVFKLVFKNHVYFFRAESQYTFERYVSLPSNTAQYKILPAERASKLENRS